MKRKYDALDWQFFSQKKNIESIEKNTKIKKDVEIVSIIEITLSLFSFSLNDIFNFSKNFGWIIIILAIIPLLWLIGKYIFIVIIKKMLPGRYIPNTAEVINFFDNDICYYVLMAESYVNKLSDINKRDEQAVSDVEQFYFIETCFYINKAIQSLSLTSNCALELFSSKWEDVYVDKKISYTRLKNIFNILDKCILISTVHYYKIGSIDLNQNFIKQCILYREKYLIFKKIFIYMDASLENVLKSEHQKIDDLKKKYDIKY